MRAQMFEKVFLAHIMSTFVAESDKLYYVNLRNEAKSLKTKEIRDFEGRDRVAERGASPANIYIVKPRGGSLCEAVCLPLVPTQKRPLNHT